VVLGLLHAYRSRNRHCEANFHIVATFRYEFAKKSQKISIPFICIFNVLKSNRDKTSSYSEYVQIF
jgi:hypothetical protein